MIIDPYLFPPNLKDDIETYTDFLAGLITSVVDLNGTVKFVVNSKANSKIFKLTEEKLKARAPNISLRQRKSEDFHDRFWLADNTRGIVIGTSLNGLGAKLFFIDELKPADVKSIFAELASINI